VLEGKSPRRANKAREAKRLGQIKHFASLVQMAMAQGVPIWKVKGGNSGLAAEAKKVFADVAARIVEWTTPEIKNG
jgi:hypothetical protein